MRRVWGVLLAVGMAGVAWGQDPTKDDPARDDSTFRVYWKDGLRLGTGNRDVQLQIGGRILYDIGWISEDRDVKAVIGDQEDGVAPRMTWIFTQGEFYERIYFKAEYGLQGGDADLMDAFLGVKGVPCAGKLQVGRNKEPFSLEWQTSMRYVTFIERGVPLFNYYNTGLTCYNAILDDRMTYAVGVYKGTDSYGAGSNEGEWSLTGRVTGAPWYESDGEQVLHVGLSATLRSPVDDTVQFSAKPKTALADPYVDTGLFDADRVVALGPEIAAVYGPASIQAEYLHIWTDSDVADDPSFKGFYVYGSFFLTGEHRVYSRSSGTFARVRPHEDFLGEEDGWGALEAAVRYSWLDLNDGTILGGELSDVTVGLNWHLNPYVRIMTNYVYADLDRVGKTNILTMRFQVDF